MHLGGECDIFITVINNITEVRSISNGNGF